MRNLQHHLVMLPWSSRYRVFKRSTASPDQAIFGHHRQLPTLPSEGHPWGGIGFCYRDTCFVCCLTVFIKPFIFSRVWRIDQYSRLLLSRRRVFFVGERNWLGCLYLQVVLCLLCSLSFVWRSSWCGWWGGAVDFRLRVCLWCTTEIGWCSHCVTVPLPCAIEPLGSFTWPFLSSFTPCKLWWVKVLCLSTQFFLLFPRRVKLLLQKGNGMLWKGSWFWAMVCDPELSWSFPKISQNPFFVSATG